MGLTEELQGKLENSIKNDELTLPTLPEIALRVRETVEDPDVSLAKLAEVISQDAALTARLVRIANSPLMRGIVKVDNLNLALSRLGMNYVQNITTGLAMEQIFQSTNELIDDRLRQTWEHSQQVAAIASIIAKHHTKLPVDKVSLIGLVHEIGVLPILTFIETHVEDFTEAEVLEQLISTLHLKIGQIILNAWDFPEELIPVPTEYLQFERDSKNGRADFSDVIMIANLQVHKIGQGSLADTETSTIMAFERLGIDPGFDIRAQENLAAEWQSLNEVFA